MMRKRGRRMERQRETYATPRLAKHQNLKAITRDLTFSPPTGRRALAHTGGDPVSFVVAGIAAVAAGTGTLLARKSGKRKTDGEDPSEIEAAGDDPVEHGDQ